ncbi:MAG: NUDIX hydrolase, partial [Bdellovibrionales bacterium]|nr:NUDIX hydrolase [Bdellovibrionales bacterium]
SLRKSRRINPRTKRPFDFLLMDGLDWVNIIALTPSNEVVLVEQYRHGVGEWTVEIPGGCVEQDEAPLDGAQRELKEETGYEVSEIEHLGSFMANPAMQSMKVHTYLARGAKQVSQPNLDAGEDIRVSVRPLGEVMSLVRTGTIQHSIVMAALFLASLKLENK